MATAFAGPLSGYFADVAGTTAPDEVLRLRAGVEAWREDLRSSVIDKVGDQLQWDEASAVAFQSDLGEAGWMAVRLFAFYAERAELELPDTVPPLLELDQDWRAAVEGKFEKSLYGQLLACEIWLPGEFPVTLRAPRPDGETAEFGSLKVMFDQLKWLNQRTFQADLDVIATWRELPAPAGGDFLPAVRRGYAALWAAVEVAQREGVPMVVRAV